MEGGVDLAGLLRSLAGPSCGAEEASAHLLGLSLHPPLKEQIREAGAIPHLLDWMRREGRSEVALTCVSVAQNLARGSHANKEELRAKGAVPLLLQLLALHPSLAGATDNLDFDEESEQIALEAGEALQECLDECSASVAEAAKCKAHKKLAKLLLTSEGRGRSTSIGLHCILHLSTSVPASDALATEGVVEFLLKTIESSPSKLYTSLAAQTISQLALHSQACRGRILETGGMQILIESLEWALTVFIKRATAPPTTGGTRSKKDASHPKDKSDPAEEQRLIFLAYKVLETLEAFSSCGAHWEAVIETGALPHVVSFLFHSRGQELQLAKTAASLIYQLQLRDSSGESIAPAPSAAPEEGEEASEEIPPSDEEAAPSEASEEEKPEEEIREVDVPRSAAELLAANHKAVLLRARHRVLEQLLSLVHGQLSTMVMEEAEDHELEQFGRHLTQAMTPCKLSLVFNKFIAGELAQVATGEAEDELTRRAVSVASVISDLKDSLLLQAARAWLAGVDV